MAELPAHSRFGASSAARWMACPGSVKASEGKPNPESPFAAEGTKLHDVAANVLSRVRDGEVIEWKEVAGLYELTSEQIEVVRLYVDTVWGDVSDDEWKYFFIERRFQLKDLHPEFFGTADAITLHDGKLRCYDLKCGAGVNVEVDYDGKVNPQLGYYLLGSIVALGGHVSVDRITFPNGEVNGCEVIVVQPRLGGVKRRWVTPEELWTLAGALHDAARLADSIPAIGVPRKAGKHCKFCLAKAECPKFKAHVQAAARSEFSKAGEASGLTDKELGGILAQADLIETWIVAVRAEAKARMDAGVTLDGYGLRQGRLGNRKWVDELTARAALVAWGLSEDHIAPRKLVSPAEAERLAKLHRGEEIDLADMVERKAPPASVERIKGGAAAEFGKVNPEDV